MVIMECQLLSFWILCITALILFLIKKISTTTHTKGKPVPGPSLLRGIKVFIKGSVEGKLHLYLPSWAEKHGEIVQVNLLVKKVIFVNDVDLFRSLVKEADYRDFTNNRPPSFFAKEFVGDDKDIVFAPMGPHLHYRRKLFHGLLKFYGEGVGRFEQLMIKTLNELADTFHASDTVGVPVSLKQYILNLVGFLSTGDISESARKNLGKIQAFSDGSIKLFGFEVDTVLQAFPWLRFIPGLHFRRYHLAMVKATKELHETYYEAQKRTFDPNNKRGMIDELLSIQQEQEKKGKNHKILLDVDTIKGLIQDVVAAAYVTTSSSLSALFLQLIKNQEIQDRIYTEIKRVMGDSVPSFEHRQSMPYTEAVILETLRFASITPLLVPHFCTRDIIFKGYLIPRSSVLIMNAWHNHHREDYWDEPFAFKPERFLTSEGQLVESSHPVRQKLIPFGYGRRACPGEAFAKSRMFLITTFLIKSFQFSPDETAPLPSSDPRDWPDGAAICPLDYKCLVKGRT